MSNNGIIITNSPEMAALTSIRLGGRAIAEVLLEDINGFEHLPQVLQRLGGELRILGQGSNILAGPGELGFVILRAGSAFKATEPEVLREYADSVLVRVPAAMPLQLFIAKAGRMGFGGMLAGLGGIPGNVGGAVAMNAGSFGTDIKSCLQAVSFFSLQNGLQRKVVEELDISYRHFSIPELAASEQNKAGQVASAPVSGSLAPARLEPFILSAEFLLPRKAPEHFKTEYAGVIAKKRTSQPVGSASAGCIFKNHSAGAAGKLLDDAGMKGHSLGGMAYSTLHANFMINTGKGQAEEALELIELAKNAVFEHCGAKLETEVRLWL